MDSCDIAAAMPTPESATALTQVRLQADVGIRVQKMAQDAEAAMASELLKSLGVGGTLDLSA